MRRIDAADTLAVVFPILWVGLAGYSAESFRDGGWDELLDRQLRVGISEFCGIEDVTDLLVHDTVQAKSGSTTRADAVGVRA